MVLHIWPFQSTLLIVRRALSTTLVRNKKEIVCTTDNNVTTVEGVYVPSEREGKVVCLDGFGDPRDTDPISRLGLNIRHTDVRILFQFLRPDGSIIPRTISGVSLRTQRHLEMMIERAKKAGLLPINITDDGKHVYVERSRHQFNVYYDSDMIGLPKLSKKTKKYVPPD